MNRNNKGNANAFFCKSPSITKGENVKTENKRMESPAKRGIFRPFRDTILYNGISSMGSAILSMILITKIIVSLVTVNPKTEISLMMEAQK